MRIIAGTSHRQLAVDVATRLKTVLVDVTLERFSNGEVRCRIEESVRGEDVFVFQSHATNVNEAIIEQVLLIDAARRASARTITAVCPFMAYARQDRKATGREPISARVIVDMMMNAGADRIVSVDLHTNQIQGFTNKPFDHIVARPTLADALRVLVPEMQDAVVVAPDAGRAKSAEVYADMLGVGMAIIHKVRAADGAPAAKHLVGEVKDKVCIIIDDMIDTAGTICAAADLLHQKGASIVFGAATHGVLSGGAIDAIEASSFKTILISDTLPLARKSEKIKVVSLADVVASVLCEIADAGSVSSLFGGTNQR